MDGHPSSLSRNRSNQSFHNLKAVESVYLGSFMKLVYKRRATDFQALKIVIGPRH